MPAKVYIPAKSKYRSQRTEVDGIKFHSKKEAARYAELRMLEMAGEISRLILQPQFGLIVNGIKIGKYIADFAYTDKEGNKIVEDVKGVRTREYLIKKNLMLACYGIEVAEV